MLFFSSTITGWHDLALHHRCARRTSSNAWLFLSLQLGPLCEREGADHRLPRGEHGSVVPHRGVLAELGWGLENLHQWKALRWGQRPVSRHHYPRCSAIFNLFYCLKEENLFCLDLNCGCDYCSGWSFGIRPGPGSERRRFQSSGIFCGLHQPAEHLGSRSHTAAGECGERGCLTALFHLLYNK